MTTRHDAEASGRRRQPRGEETRRKVLEATLRLLAREGPHGVTHRAVAREAGTSARATTYYFASREALLREALAHYAATAGARIDALARPIGPTEADPLGAAAELLARTVLSDVVDDREGLLAEYELVLETSRQPELAPAYRAWQDRLEGVLRGYAELFGSDDPGADARLVLAALRGLELEALARPGQPPTVGDLTPILRRLLEGLYARKR